MTVFMFPGQGSQKKGMGGELFSSVEQFKRLEAEIDNVLGYSLRQMCLEDPENQLKDTRYAQPCLYVVNALSYFDAVSRGAQPTIAIGHSVGEFNALMAAGAFDLLTGLRLVQKRGELMARAKNGGMAAIVGLRPERIKALLDEKGLSDLDIANYNSAQQTVVSGPLDVILRAGPIFEGAGASLYFPLRVSAAFHSRYMAQAGRAFDEFLAGVKFSTLQISVISNVTAQPYPTGDASSVIRSLLVKQISAPVLWAQTITSLLEQGVRDAKEVGPGQVLTKLFHEAAKDFVGTSSVVAG